MIARINIGHGEQAVYNTLRVMAAMADDGRDSDTVRAFARGVVRAAGRDPAAQVRHVFAWLRSRVRFVADPPADEYVRTPAEMIDRATRHGAAVGDCDDRSTLGAAILSALGIPAAFVVVADRPGGPFVHVLFAAKIDGRWVDLDPQETDAPGKIPPNAWGRTLVPVAFLRK